VLCKLHERVCELKGYLFAVNSIFEPDLGPRAAFWLPIHHPVMVGSSSDDVATEHPNAGLKRPSSNM